MKKIFVLGFGILNLNSFSQNDVQVFNLNNLSNSNIQLQQQSRAVQTFASNVQIKRNTYKPVNTVKPANKVTQANNVIKRPPIQRRRTVRRNSNSQVQDQQPLPQINFVNIPSQINPPVQLSNDDQIFQINAPENNLGNSFGNEQLAIQQAAPVQDKQTKRFSDPLEGLGFDINMPKMNVRTRSTSASSGALSVSYKLNHLRNKFLKVNRKMKGKLSFKKRLRLKVDTCFKW
jgi:hypothetical protein